jgi:hypothetical protein
MPPTAEKEKVIIEELSRRIVTSADIVKYIKAGNATFTLRSVQTGKRFTYKVSAVKDRKDPKKKIAGFFFVALMTGPDNEASFTYLGTLSGSHFSLTRKSRLPITSQPVAAFDFTWKYLLSHTTLSEQIEFWHSGRCGHCGKKLTVPESIELGIGPICANKM